MISKTLPPIGRPHAAAKNSRLTKHDKLSSGQTIAIESLRQPITRPTFPSPIGGNRPPSLLTIQNATITHPGTSRHSTAEATVNRHDASHELDPEILLGAYAQGIFPMADDDSDELMWFSPDPRAIIPLDDFHVSNNLRRLCRSDRFQVTVDLSFDDVIAACAHRTQGTWISDDIATAYKRLHRLGFAHSLETRRDGKLVGGLYGVSLGGAFFGESMFHHERDASKVALVHLVNRMNERGFTLLDTQFITPHLVQFGAIEIPRSDYLQRLRIASSADRVFAD
jgi:leucyl/phenylalanyl-tRNA---protein transferase